MENCKRHGSRRSVAGPRVTVNRTRFNRFCCLLLEVATLKEAFISSGYSAVRCCVRAADVTVLRFEGAVIMPPKPARK